MREIMKMPSAGFSAASVRKAMWSLTNVPPLDITSSSYIRTYAIRSRYRAYRVSNNRTRKLSLSLWTLICWCGACKAMAVSFLRLGPMRVDLGPLQFARIIDVDGFPFRKNIERLRARFAVAVSGTLRASEGKVDLRPDRRRVDVGDPGLHIADRAHHPVNVLGVNGPRKAVDAVIEHLNRFVEGFHPDQNRHRAEYLLLRDGHAR